MDPTDWQRRQRRAFTPEQKADAVRLCRQGSRTIRQVAADLDSRGPSPPCSSPPTPTALPSLGTAAALAGLGEADLWALWRRHLAPHRLTLAAAGPLALALGEVEDVLEAVPGSAGGAPLPPPTP